MNENTNYQLPATHYHLKSGLTLVEFVTSIAILGVLTLMIGSVYLAHFRLFSSQSASIDTSAQNKIAIEEISNQIRESVGVDNSTRVPCNANSDGTKLVLKLWPLNASGAPIDPSTSGGSYDYVLYKKDASNNNFVKSVCPSPSNPQSYRRSLTDKILASNIQIQGVTLFVYEAPSGVITNSSWVTVTLKTQPKNSKETPFTQTVKVYLRNR